MAQGSRYEDSTDFQTVAKVSVVHFLFLIESAQTFMIMDDVFFWFVHNFGNYPALLRFNVAAIDGPFLDVVITFTVQIVYCWRLRKIGQWKILPIITALVSLLRDCWLGEIDTADE